jgi:hypothetical protein
MLQGVLQCSILPESVEGWPIRGIAGVAAPADMCLTRSGQIQVGNVPLLRAIAKGHG